jgi:hypothetical protein
MAIVAAMLACVCLSLVLLRPDLGEMLSGLFDVANLRYPEWVDHYPKVRQRPLWVELATYVGVIGGSGYDYLAYVSYLREKNWGASGGRIYDAQSLAEVADNPQHAHRRWLVAPLIDCTISFLVVFVFSAAFVTCGALLLGPQQRIPAGSDLLTLQADFVSTGQPALRQLYFAGAFLAIFGTLYGTIEVGPAIARELLGAVSRCPIDASRLRTWVVAWEGVAAAGVIGFSLVRYLLSDKQQPPELIAILTPANLFTGVLACGIIGGLSLWSDYWFLPKSLRPSRILMLLNAIGGLLFLAVGLRAYWDQGGAGSFAMLFVTLGIGWIAAWVYGRRS